MDSARLPVLPVPSRHRQCCTALVKACSYRTKRLRRTRCVAEQDMTALGLKPVQVTAQIVWCTCRQAPDIYSVLLPLKCAGPCLSSLYSLVSRSSATLNPIRPPDGVTCASCKPWQPCNLLFRWSPDPWIMTVVILMIKSAPWLCKNLHCQGLKYRYFRPDAGLGCPPFWVCWLPSTSCPCHQSQAQSDSYPSAPTSCSTRG